MDVITILSVVKTVYKVSEWLIASTLDYGSMVLQGSIVVYFDQRTHAYACVHMVQNNKKCYKIVKKVESVFSFLISYFYFI